MRSRVLPSIFVLSLPFFALAAPADDDGEASLFVSATAALHDGRAGDAIAALEALADRGVVDAVASYDRGLAYAMRIRVGAEVPGDLGRAIQGLEEARDLSRDARLAKDASLALFTLRSEVARRRARTGDPVEVDPGRSLARAVAGLLSEDVWAWCAAIASAALALALFVRWLARAPRVQIGGGVAAGIAAPVLAISVAMTLAARHDRESLHEAVVVAANARPADERGITVPGASPLPEGARVEVFDSRAGRLRIRFGALDTWIASTALRDLARAN